ncbi:HK97-gp10 family putative phage morphogenesis protein [Mesorhizobium xinjiangense]|uniref:HK97-gp10 family putative phage morphogenesis protein n=1 Tax=Mesorhizobium xinjiangense TaxID=2678685 RepID=UPI0022A73E24|nr:HK97-gp10 family putative phage morphogenesis protein [Mesorhizobium xinjiangense]
MATRVKIDGLKELERALAELPKATGKNVLRRTLRKAAQPVADAMRDKAPDDPNTGGNDLRSSIAVSTKLSKRQKSQHRKMFKSDKASVEIFVGAGPLPQAHLQEFGAPQHGPQSFARPAWDANKRQVLDTIKDDLGEEIVKAAKRLAKKAAKAKG